MTVQIRNNAKHVQEFQFPREVRQDYYEANLEMKEKMKKVEQDM